MVGDREGCGRTCKVQRSTVSAKKPLLHSAYVTRIVYLSLSAFKDMDFFLLRLGRDTMAILFRSCGCMIPRVQVQTRQAKVVHPLAPLTSTMSCILPIEQLKVHKKVVWAWQRGHTAIQHFSLVACFPRSSPTCHDIFPCADDGGGLEATRFASWCGRGFLLSSGGRAGTCRDKHILANVVGYRMLRTFFSWKCPRAVTAERARGSFLSHCALASKVGAFRCLVRSSELEVNARILARSLLTSLNIGFQMWLFDMLEQM